MEHKIKIDDNMSDKRRENAYRNIKAVLSDIGIPGSHAEEVALNWHIQEDLNKIMAATKRTGLPDKN